MNDRLEGLLLPELEEAFNKELWFGVVLLICFFIFVIWRWKIQGSKPSFVARKKLKELMLELKKSEGDSRSIALKVVRVLCLGFGVKRLDQYKPVKMTEWKVFQEKLNTACYSSCINVDATKLLNEADNWLKAQNG